MAPHDHAEDAEEHEALVIEDDAGNIEGQIRIDALVDLLTAKGLIKQWSSIKINAGPSRLLKFIGQHSLAYYLIHQPVLFAILYMIHYFVR